MRPTTASGGTPVLHSNAQTPGQGGPAGEPLMAECSPTQNRLTVYIRHESNPSPPSFSLYLGATQISRCATTDTYVMDNEERSPDVTESFASMAWPPTVR